MKNLLRIQCLFATFLAVVLLACRARAATSPNADEEGARAALDRIQAGYADGRLHGAAAIVRPGQPTLRASSDAETLSGSSRFRIASLTKLLVRVAFLRLVDQERVELEAPLSVYRPGLQADWASRVTLTQLLTFRSGLPRERPAPNPVEAGVVFDADGSALRFLDTLGDVGPTVPPGSRTAYSNLGYMHLGGVLEAISEKPIEEALRELVFAPAGMSDTGLFGADLLDGSLHVHGHQRGADGELAVVDAFPASVRYTAGGLYSTVDDLERLSLALLQGDLLTPSSRELFFSDLGREDDGRVRAAGLLPGFASVWLLSSDPPFAIVMLNNAVPSSPEPIVALLDQAAECLRPAVQAASGRAPIEDEGWLRVTSLKHVPEHGLLEVAGDYLAALAADDPELLFECNMRARRIDPIAMGENDRKGYAFAATMECEEFQEYGPFRFAAWRAGEADGLDLYLEGPAGRAIFFRFVPDPDQPRRARSIAYGTVGFMPEREPNPYFEVREE